LRRFLVIGCGGSGSATLRFMMDQLLADLRPYGVTQLPPAWQFVSIDVPTSPDTGPAPLGSVRDLGGRYLSVSSNGNSYTLAANLVERALDARGNMRGLLGWAPSPKEAAAHVPVENGAGQFRAVGRMLTLTDLADIQAEMEHAWGELQRPDVWGQVPSELLHNYDPEASVVPIVVGSMAGGSGASMFLDVCRLLGRLSGLRRTSLGVFLFTADVFGNLPEGARSGIEGNALGTLGEIMAAQTGLSTVADSEMFTALGRPPEINDDPPFARIFPVGSAIGGDGAKFGGGTQLGVYRGLGRALSAIIGSDRASTEYISYKIANPNPQPINRDLFGWGTSGEVIPWGSIGYASLSLGRDRYTDYAAQRIARKAFDRLLRGHLNPMSQLPATEQLKALMDAQWATVLDRLQFPAVGGDVRAWFITVALPEHIREVEARRSVGEAMDRLDSETAGRAAAWVETVRARIPQFQAGTREQVRESAYAWANSWADQLEVSVREEFLRTATQLGIPFARELARRLSQHCDGIIDELRRGAAGGIGDPLLFDAEVSSRALALKKTVIGPGHELAERIKQQFTLGAKKSLNREASRLAAEVLSSFAKDVLGGLQRTAQNAILDLERAEAARTSDVGLAQLATTTYSEWPSESNDVPARFDHADNEVLLTTSAEFPARFRSDVSASVPAEGLFESALAQIVGEVVIGRWETAGGHSGNLPVLTQVSPWRPPILPVAPVSKTPTPASQPTYALAVSTGDLLSRAHAHLNRADQPFEQFSSQSIVEYLSDVTQPDAELARRREEFVAKFIETMHLARPLVGVSGPMIATMHPGATLRYEYTFGDIGLSPQDGVAAKITAILAADSTLDGATQGTFAAAVKDNVQDGKIHMFGSYPKYSPLVFSSLLAPIQARWAGAPDQALADLWRWKRTRPLNAGVGLGQAELRSMAAGWFLGRMLGLVRVPASPRSADPVQVWDFRTLRWLAFPNPLLTSPTTFRAEDDWFAAVLESHSLALVQCNGDTSLTALQPYRALRNIFDETAEDPLVEGAYQQPVAVQRLADWFASGTWPSGSPSLVLPASELNGFGVTPETRAAIATKWLEAVAAYISVTYLTSGSAMGSLGAAKTRITSAAQLGTAPMFAEVADTVFEALQTLSAYVEAALAAAARAEAARAVAASQTGGADAIARPNM
jgi:hypothetical protein